MQFKKINKISFELIQMMANLEIYIFEANGYSIDEIQSFNNNDSFNFYLAIDQTNILIGYAICFETIDTIEIYKIGVLQTFRKKRIGSKILDLIKKENKNIFVEVSDKDNTKDFYYKNNFKFITIRKNYYFDKSNAYILKYSK